MSPVTDFSPVTHFSPVTDLSPVTNVSLFTDVSPVTEQTSSAEPVIPSHPARKPAILKVRAKPPKKASDMDGYVICMDRSKNVERIERHAGTQRHLIDQLEESVPEGSRLVGLVLNRGSQIQTKPLLRLLS